MAKLSLWEIEDVDNAGEGLFICMARTRKEALALHKKHCSTARVVLVEKAMCISLALLTGRLGESYYGRRIR